MDKWTNGANGQPECDMVKLWDIDYQLINGFIFWMQTNYIYDLLLFIVYTLYTLTIWQHPCHTVPQNVHGYTIAVFPLSFSLFFSFFSSIELNWFSDLLDTNLKPMNFFDRWQWGEKAIERKEIFKWDT